MDSQIPGWYVPHLHPGKSAEKVDILKWDIEIWELKYIILKYIYKKGFAYLNINACMLNQSVKM